MRNSCSSVFIMATHSILRPRVAYFPPGKINILQCIYFESSSNQATMSILHSFRQTLTCCVWGLLYQKTDVSSGGKKKEYSPFLWPLCFTGVFNRLYFVHPYQQGWIFFRQADSNAYFFWKPPQRLIPRKCLARQYMVQSSRHQKFTLNKTIIF